MLTKEQLTEQYLEHAKQLSNDLADYLLEYQEKLPPHIAAYKNGANHTADQLELFKGWVVQKLALLEVLQKNATEQQAVVVELLGNLNIQPIQNIPPSHCKDKADKADNCEVDTWDDVLGEER